MTKTLIKVPITGEHLQELINRVPRLRLAHTPTPLDELPRLARLLGGPRLFAKRDDLTGLAFGGNKVRNLEFRMAEALAVGADTIIMYVDVLSNLGLDLHAETGEIDNRDEYVGESYGIPSAAGNEAVRLAARTDGLLLDPVYTGKAFAAIIDDVRQGRLGPADAAVFIHTGGLPLLFNVADQLGSILA